MIKIETSYPMKFERDINIRTATMLVKEDIVEFESDRTHCRITIEKGNYTITQRFIFICKSDGTAFMTTSELRSFIDDGIIELLESEIILDQSNYIASITVQRI